MDCCNLRNDDDDREAEAADLKAIGRRAPAVFQLGFTVSTFRTSATCFRKAFGMGKKGFMTEQGFSEFAFAEVARRPTRNDPAFFKGAIVEQAVAELGLDPPLP